MKDIKSLITTTSLISLSITGCQWVTAQNELFTVQNNWQYLGEVVPDLTQEIRQIPILDQWIGDPRKMKVIEINNFAQQSPLYLVNTTVGYPEGINTITDELDDYYRPLCNRSGECTFLIYKQTEESYSLVFDEQLAFTHDDNWFRFSNTLYQGYPRCFEIMGYDRTRRDGWQVPDPKENQQLVSRYCYNGNRYVFDRIYLKTIEEKINE